RTGRPASSRSTGRGRPHRRIRARLRAPPVPCREAPSARPPRVRRRAGPRRARRVGARARPPRPSVRSRTAAARTRAPARRCRRPRSVPSGWPLLCLLVARDVLTYAYTVRVLVKRSGVLVRAEEERPVTQPPYRRIADEIRARIADRGLRPGDPVPSARGITREWGVALATATKVLATLKAQGATRALPGRGTVVADLAVPVQPEASPRASRRHEGDPDLTRERIVAAAIRVADAEGLTQLSMRRIATELGTAPMSLYRHVNGKDELLVFMTDSVFGDDPLPSAPP